jgi:hypothetical protein
MTLVVDEAAVRAGVVFDTEKRAVGEWKIENG